MRLRKLSLQACLHEGELAKYIALLQNIYYVLIALIIHMAHSHNTLLYKVQLVMPLGVEVEIAILFGNNKVVLDIQRDIVLRLQLCEKVISLKDQQSFAGEIHSLNLVNSEQ